MARIALFDGFMSAMGRVGDLLGNRTSPCSPFGGLTDQQIDAAYRTGWVVRKTIDKPATEMVREWRDWQADAKQIEEIEKLERALDLRNKVKRAEILRGLGGAAMVLGVKQGDSAMPINPRALKAGSLAYIHVLHRSKVGLGPIDEDPNSPTYGEPQFFDIPRATGTAARFHPSRIIAFKAEPTPGINGGGLANDYWGDSKVQAVLDAADNVASSQNGFAALIKDARNRRLYVPGLTERIATDEQEGRFAKRVAALAYGENMMSVTYLDGGDKDGKGGETLQDRQMVWAGIPDIAAMYLSALAAAADMPATVLLGKSPDGMNATGAGDLAVWEKTIKARQDLDLRPLLNKLDDILIPSAIGAADDAIWWQFAPLSTLSEKEEAETFNTTMDAATKLQATGAIPDIAFTKGLQNLMKERGWMPGLDGALAEIPDDERFPEAEDDDLTPELEGGDQGTGGNGVPLRRAANDARFTDAAPKTLYVSRKLINTADFIKWAKSQGFETTTPADELHVTIAFSRQAIDWMKVGQDWSSDKEGRLTVNAGGPRLVERLGDKGAIVLLFQSNDLKWRHDAIKEAGASFDFDEYQPHVTISYQAPEGLDLAKVQPYVGPLVFGPELFAEVVDDWEKTVSEA